MTDHAPTHGTLARAAQHHDEGDRLCADCLTAERDYAFVEWKRMRAIADDLRDDRDRARDIAVHLEQENAELRASRDRWRRRFFEQAAKTDRIAADAVRYRREANVMHSVVQEAGLLAEWLTRWDGTSADMLRQVLDGATFEEVTHG